jgi:UDP-glucuronate 4-epimerase
MNIFITGIAGMIGFHLSNSLVLNNYKVSGMDNFNDYYDVNLKKDRANILRNKNINIFNSDLRSTDSKDWTNFLQDIDVVIHLAAYANPRHALENQQTYIDNNITGTNILIKALEANKIKKVIYASSSCVMHGQNLPWKESDSPEHQNNPYGWSKRVNECQFMHSKIFQTIGLRFFTVYGPYGRPDMALFSFTKNILEDRKIHLYNFGNMQRDFTYVDDIVSGIFLVIDKVKNENIKYDEIYNIGYGQKVNLADFVSEIEKNLGRKANKVLSDHHPGDTSITWADISKIKKIGYKPKTPIYVGVPKFVEWYKKYYKVD